MSGAAPVMRLGDVGIFLRGRRFTKNDAVQDGIPSIHYGEIYTSYGISADHTVSRVRNELRSQLRFARPGDVVIAAVGETVEDVGKGVAWLGDTEVAIHDDCFLFRSEVLDPVYVSHHLRTAALIREKDQYIARAKVKRISGENLARLRIPVPSLVEQQTIVATLEMYSTALADLSHSLLTELEAREKQYRYYRDRMFDVGGTAYG